MTTEERPCNKITTLLIYDNVDVILTRDIQHKIQVSAPSYLIEKIETTLDGSTLTIRNNNKFNWTHDLNPSLTVYINSDSLQYLAFYGTSNVRTETAIECTDFKLTVGKNSGLSNGIINLEVHADKVEVQQNDGYSDITVSGSTNYLYLTNNAYGLMKLSEMYADVIYIKNDGANNTFIRANTSIWGYLSHVGDVYYYGNPPIVNVSVTGIGQLIKAE